ncbi:MAG: TlpA family protein disulfide reductase [Deltaproteobacteria bacterium]|nr:TlpA family protein disulfide reductase [Deltaproteobacteria bacterium]
MRVLAVVVGVLLAVLPACQTIIYVQQDDGGAAEDPDGGKRPDGRTSSDGSLTPPPLPDAGRIQNDAGPQQDAARQSDASCGPGSGVYACGPFGASEGAIMANESLWGYYDTNGNGSVTDEGGGSFDLARYYLLSASGAKILYLNVSAPWCSTCQTESARLRSLYQEFHGRGVEFLIVLWDLGAHSEALDWADYFNLPFAVADDSGPKRLEKYWDGSGIPMTMFIDLRTMKILSIVVDWDEVAFKAKLNSYLAAM